MATKQIFDGKVITLPGVYTSIKSGLKNPPLDLPYGNILIIDTGSLAGFGGGSGIEGDLASGVNAVYELPDVFTYQNYMKGGLFWKLAEPLFYPNGFGSLGVSKAYVVKAATTTKGAIVYTWVGGGANGGTITVNPKDEGLIANGVETVGDNLYVGYAATMSAGVIDAAKFIVKFWRGTWKGKDANDVDYGVSQDLSQPLLLCQTPEFVNVSELIPYFGSDGTFNAYFVGLAVPAGTGVVDGADLTASAGNKLCAGGTETYLDTNSLTFVFDAVTDLDYSFILADKWGDDGQDTEVSSILAHIRTEAKFEKQLIIGGGVDFSEWIAALGSISTAEYYDDDRVIIVHGGIKIVSSNSGTGFRLYDSIYKAAAVLGRLCGLPPQVPLTFKGIKIDGEQHSLTEREKELGLEKGVLMTAWDNDFNRFAVVQDVNSLQNNDYLINEDGTTHSISIRRIAAHLNKELLINAKKQLLGQVAGVNRYTLSSKNVRDWVIGYLQRKTVTPTSDNLILGFQDVTVTRNQDVYEVTYKFIPNGPINKLFITGFMIEG